MRARTPSLSTAPKLAHPPPPRPTRIRATLTLQKVRHVSILTLRMRCFFCFPLSPTTLPHGRHHSCHRLHTTHTHTHPPFALLHVHTVLPPCACTPCLPPFTPGPHAHERRAPSLPTFPPPRAPGPLSFYFKYHNSALESSQLNAWPLVASDHIGWFDCFPAFEVGPGADCVFARLGNSNR